MTISVCFYEDWMKPQVSKMFSSQYNVDEKAFAEYMDKFYDHPFQKNKCIRIVALERDKVVGFQSFAYWPYNYGETTFNSYQSGNSLIHKDYRGKGIFNRLLEFVETEKINVDFFTGFPIEVSKNNLIKDKWKNIVNLSWFVKMLNPFAFLFINPEKKLVKCFNTSTNSSPDAEGEYFRLNNDKDFLQWRKYYSANTRYYYYEYTEGKDKITFEMKFNKRKKIINELIIGNVNYNPPAEVSLNNALKALLKKLSKTLCITIVTIAVNEDFEYSIVPVLKKNNFRKLSKSIYFMVKPFKMNEFLLKREKWNLYRSDIDTWWNMFSER